MTTSSGIFQFFLRDSTNLRKQEPYIKYDELKFQDLLEYNRLLREHRSDDFLPSLDFYLGILQDTDRVLFEYMKEERLEQLRFDLYCTLLLLLAQQQQEIDYQKTENRKTYLDHIKRCTELLYFIDLKRKKIPHQVELTDGKPIAYLGILLGKEYGQKLLDLMESTTEEKSKTKTIKDFMGTLNDGRLYWVWGSTFLKTVIDLVPDAINASNAIRWPDPFAGSLSWALYYFRFSLNLFLLLKHTIGGSWMSDEEAKTPWYERFEGQWTQRKFTLLNDSLWGTSNFLSFFWLNGKGILGTWGDALTVILLVFDIAVAIWDFEEQKAKYYAEMLQFENDIRELRLAIDELYRQKYTKNKEEQQQIMAKIQQMEMQINALERAQAKCKRDWEYQKLALINTIAYSLGLMLAFIVLAMPFMPVAAPVAALLGVVGAILCLAFTVMNNAIKGGIELYKTHQTLKDIEAEYNDKIIMLRSGQLPENEKRLLYLEIKKLEADTGYQKQMMVYQSLKMVHSIMLEALMPALIFSSLVFFPMGTGILALAFVLASAITTRFLIDYLFKPEERKELTPFNEEEYVEFCEENNKQMFFNKHDISIASSLNEEELPMDLSIPIN